MSRDERGKADKTEKHFKEELHDLQHLFEAGKIDEEEYDRRKHRLRNMLGNSAALHE